ELPAAGCVRGAVTPPAPPPRGCDERPLLDRHGAGGALLPARLPVRPDPRRVHHARVRALGGGLGGGVPGLSAALRGSRGAAPLRGCAGVSYLRLRGHRGHPAAVPLPAVLASTTAAAGFAPPPSAVAGRASRHQPRGGGAVDPRIPPRSGRDDDAWPRGMRP